MAVAVRPSPAPPAGRVRPVEVLHVELGRDDEGLRNPGREVALSLALGEVVLGDEEGADVGRVVAGCPVAFRGGEGRREGGGGRGRQREEKEGTLAHFGSLRKRKEFHFRGQNAKVTVCDAQPGHISVPLQIFPSPWSAPFQLILPCMLKSHSRDG